MSAHGLTLAVLASPLGRLFGGMAALRFTGRASGREVALPVQCARDGSRLVVLVARSGSKRWWRNFLDGREVRVRTGGAEGPGRGRVVAAEHPDRGWAEGVYRRRFPRIDPSAADPFVVIDLGPT